jgi:hypothetical protein
VSKRSTCRVRNWKGFLLSTEVSLCFYTDIALLVNRDACLDGLARLLSYFLYKVEEARSEIYEMRYSSHLSSADSTVLASRMSLAINAMILVSI